MNGIAVQSDGRCLANLFHLGAGEAVRPQVPKQKVVVGSIARQLVPLAHQSVSKRLGIGLDLLGVILEHGAVHLEQLRCQASNLVVVRASLESREDGHVNTLLDVGDLLGILEEDHSSARPAQRLVRRGCHDVAMLEGRRMLSCCHQPGNVGNVRHEDGTNLVCNLPELAEVDHAWVRRGTTEDHGGSEDEGRLPELVEVDQASLRVDAVGQGLEVDGCCRNLLLCSVVAVGQVSTGRQVQPHHPGVRRKQRRVDGKVRRASGVGLDVHAPLLLVQAEGLQCSILAKVLHLVNDLIATVVTIAGLALRVLVRQSRPQALHDCTRSEVLGGNELNATRLSGLLLLNEVVHHRVSLLQRPVPGKRWAVADLGASGDTLGGDHELGVSLDRLEGGRLGIADLSQALQDADDHLFQVQGVEVEPGSTAFQQLLAHVNTLLDSELLERLVGGVCLLRTLHEALGHTGLAQLRHPLQPAKAVEAHDARDDGDLDVVLAALGHEVEEDLRVQEHLGDDEVGACVDLLLEVDHLLVEVGIAANGDDFLAFRILRHSGAALLGRCQGSHSALDHLDVVRVALRVAGNGHGEVVAVVFTDELDQVEGAREAAFRGRPLLLAAGRVAAERDDVTHTVLPAFLQRVSGHLRTLVRAGQVHVGHGSELILGR
mmetsp:Transcript_14659/g.34798  ORF Transcript_14659/g.34798 Transcript_14659/m.34798 type:complete len:659 (+) Transcript_14659:337-2313(+)